MRELKSLQAAIDAAEAAGMSQEEVVDPVAAIKVEWSWGGASDSEKAAKADGKTKWKV